MVGAERKQEPGLSATVIVTTTRVPVTVGGPRPRAEGGGHAKSVLWVRQPGPDVGWAVCRGAWGAPTCLGWPPPVGRAAKCILAHRGRRGQCRCQRWGMPGAPRALLGAPALPCLRDSWGDTGSMWTLGGTCNLHGEGWEGKCPLEDRCGLRFPGLQLRDAPRGQVPRALHPV